MTRTSPICASIVSRTAAPVPVSAKQAAGLDAIKIIIEDGPPPWRPKLRLTVDQVRRIENSRSIVAVFSDGLPVTQVVTTP